MRRTPTTRIPSRLSIIMHQVATGMLAEAEATWGEIARGLPEAVQRDGQLEAQALLCHHYLLQRTDRLTEAALSEALERTRGLNQRSFERDLWRQRGQWLQAKGNDAAAADAFARAIEMAHEARLRDTEAEAQRGLSLLRLGRRSEAEAAAAAAARAPPHYALAELYGSSASPTRRAITRSRATSCTGATARPIPPIGPCKPAAPCSTGSASRRPTCRPTIPPNTRRSRSRPTSAACSTNIAPSPNSRERCRERGWCEAWKVGHGLKSRSPGRSETPRLGPPPSRPPFAGGTPIGANFGLREATGAIEGAPSPPPFWGRAREGGRFGLDETQRKGRFSRLPPSPALPHKGGGSSQRRQFVNQNTRLLRPIRLN